MLLNGFDISNYQKGIELSRVSCDFVIIKATQGATYVSPSFERQIKEAFSLNKLVGVYHYINGEDYVAEVNHFLSVIKPYLGKVLICVDWEKDMNIKFGDNTYITNLMDLIYKNIKIKPVIYMSKAVCREKYWSSVPNNYDLWVAQYKDYSIVTGYNKNPWTDDKGYGSFKNPIIYQYTNRGNLPGYSGFLDLDIAYITKKEWISKCIPDNIKVKMMYTVNASTLNIREKPDSSSKDVGDLKKGSIITVDKIENGFAHFEGWCSTKYLE